MSPWLLLVLLSLATYRLARLLVKDRFPLVRIPREKIEAWATANPRFEAVGDLATCSWCASGWVAMLLVVAVDLLSHTPVPLPPVLWAAVWAVGALVAWAEGRLEPDPDAKPAPAAWAAPAADPVGDVHRYADEEWRRYKANPLGPDPQDVTQRIDATQLED